MIEIDSPTSMSPDDKISQKDDEFTIMVTIYMSSFLYHSMSSVISVHYCNRCGKVIRFLSREIDVGRKILVNIVSLWWSQGEVISVTASPGSRKNVFTEEKILSLLGGCHVELNQKIRVSLQS